MAYTSHTRIMEKKYNIGCSGYYYTAWKNKFYPTGMQPKEWLQYYSGIFNTVELNGTFYRTPKSSDLKKYREATSDDFSFSVKVSKNITHLQKLKDTAQFTLEFQELIREGLQEKLNYFLFQLPPSFHYSEENLERIIQNIPHTPQNVVELRHISWWNETTEKAFKDAGITFCNIDYPGIKSYFINTSDHFYLRLHGNPDLFKSSYEINELKKFYSAFPEKCKYFTTYFNNTFYEAGYTNALQLIEIIENA